MASRSQILKKEKKDKLQMMINTGREPDKENAITTFRNNTQGWTNVLFLLFLSQPAWQKAVMFD